MKHVAKTCWGILKTGNISSVQSRQTFEGCASLCTSGMLIRRVVNVSLGVLIGCLSAPVVMNLVSSRQVMNTSFDPLRIVNTYGAFGRCSWTLRIRRNVTQCTWDYKHEGRFVLFFLCCHRPRPLESITKERTEVIFQGTVSQDPKAPEAVWEEYQFVCKPGDIHRRPCLISPYHYRLDWLMWFAAFQVRTEEGMICGLKHPESVCWRVTYKSLSNLSIRGTCHNTKENSIICQKPLLFSTVIIH